MANYMSYQRTGYFKVTDKKKLEEIAEKFNATLVEEKEGFALIDNGEEDIYSRYCEDCDDYLDIFNDIQEILPDNEAAIFFEVGYEKMRYLVGSCVVVTSNDIVGKNIEEAALDIAEDLTGNSDIRLWY